VPNKRAVFAVAIVVAGVAAKGLTVTHQPGHPAQLLAVQQPAKTGAAGLAVSTQSVAAQFIAMVAPGAETAQQQYGVPAAVTIAQAIDESNWGESSLAEPPYHNLFGIKGTGTTGSVTMPTQEYENGGWVTIDAQFRTYATYAQSIADHAYLLATSGYYTQAMNDRGDPDQFANDLTGVYATSPDYGTELIAFMRTYNLYQYDTATSVPAPTASPSSIPAATASAKPRPAASQSSAPADGTADIPGVITPVEAPSTGPETPQPSDGNIPGASPAPTPSATPTGDADIPGVPG
jgi:flagellum-specific peptidoglycan hydrolase FlgJ